MIFVERDKPLSRKAIDEKLAVLQRALDTEDDEIIRNALKQVVPTYHSPIEVNERAVEAEDMKNARKIKEQEQLAG